MTNDQIISGSYELMVNDFRLSPEGQTLPASESELLKHIESHLSYLLDHDFSQLLNLMYRIDISEDIFKEILMISDPQKMTASLSRVVLEREKAKFLSRNSYKVKKK